MAAAAPSSVPSSRRFRRAGPYRRSAARSPRALPRCHRSVPRGTDCLPREGRCSREHLGGARGRDGGDAGVRSCNAKGQGESSRSLASADPRPTSCVGAGCMSRRRRERLWRSGRAGVAAGITRCDGYGATRLGAVPRSSAGADPSRGAGRWSYRGAALRLASCTRRRRATGIAAGLCSTGRMRKTQSDRSDASSIATDCDSRNPPIQVCELRALPILSPRAPFFVAFPCVGPTQVPLSRPVVPTPRR